MVWYTNTPLYFTDPGDLSTSVDHAAADALVAAAASVWNVPTSALTLARGGALAEHVSGANSYIGPNGPVFPVDVSSGNFASIQIAVVYDSDGSITDLLLGQGASDPENCRQNGVTESVDSIIPAGKIQHALLILNGRCSGSAKEQQLQLQYQLERAFGRVLGLAWSQTNDNVFTGTPQPTAMEIANWPIMHPVDIVCGPYTYQCLPSPFTLRIDDVASISQLYFIAQGTATVGKVDTLSNASAIDGRMLFGDGISAYGGVESQGMQGMNLLVRRKQPASSYIEPSPVLSVVSGVYYRWDNGNPVTGSAGASVSASMGAVDPLFEGVFEIGAIPLLPGLGLQDVYITTEPINPLYTGEYGIGPYPGATVSPSGPVFPWNDNGVVPYEANYYIWSVPGSVAECAATGLGTETAPLPFAASGWWNSVLCGYGVSAWQTVTVKPGRNLTIEATALDDQGMVTETKLEPLVGVWQSSDAAGSLPTVAASASPFNSLAAGLTLVNFDTVQAGMLRLAITDERGDGRPDFGFRARVLYADSIAPGTVTANGGLVLISGMGFRPGNQVTIGGIGATVISSTANTILAVAPPFAKIQSAALPAGTGLTVDVEVVDPATGGAAIIYGGLSYPASALPSQTPQVSVLTPAFYIAAGERVGIVPVVSLSNAGAVATGMTVSWTSISGSLSFANGGRSVSDSSGSASIAAMTGSLSGGAQATGSACAFAGVCASFAVYGIDPSQWLVTAIEGQGQSLPSSGILQPVVVQVTDGAGHPILGAPVAIYQTVSGWVVCPAMGRCPIAPVYQTAQTSAVSDANGLVVVVPQQLTGTPEVTTIACAAGTQGFISISLEKHP